MTSVVRRYWADPRGEFLSCVHADPVYAMLGLEGLGTDLFPQTGQPLNTGRIGYHLRDGGHNLTECGWNCFMDFADRHWKPDAQ